MIDGFIQSDSVSSCSERGDIRERNDSCETRMA